MERDRFDNAMVALLRQDEPPRDLTLTASNAAYMDSGAKENMIQANYILTGNEGPSNATIATSVKDNMRAKTQCKSTVMMSRGQKSL